uniref:ATP synthase F0 subunit 8 n=1 Tax=Iphione sp. YZ-2018 TaxID=2153332 RepID=A0A343W6H0_9ANNE|nr:ATP synthase F0 subunit 8 [Iphione sp. YZ-2018]
MPHFSPMNWIMMPVIFWSLLTSLGTLLWWSQSPSFPKMSSAFPMNTTPTWHW